MGNGKTKSLAAPPSETRNIVIAQGIQFNNKDLNAAEQVPGGVDTDASPHTITALKTRMANAGMPLTVNAAGDGATFRSVKQGVNFTIKVVNTKSAFKAALESDKTHHVIYDGHSRYGRGCCFGTNMAAGEDWENGSTPSTTGLFRMGLPYVAVPVSDIKHHGYTADLVPTSETLAPAKCESDLRRAVNAGSVQPHGLTAVDASVRGQLRINKKPIGSKDRFWAFDWSGEGFSVVVHAGWEKTASDPMDLGAVNMKCRVFCHFGCSSMQHYHEIVRDRKHWNKVGNTDNFAYFTSGLSYSFTGPIWLFHILTYDQFNAGQPWEPSLNYARKNAKDDLKKVCAELRAKGQKVVTYEIK